MKFLGQGFGKLKQERDRQTDRQRDGAECITMVTGHFAYDTLCLLESSPTA